jgi:hypothetical protein
MKARIDELLGRKRNRQKDVPSSQGQ